MASALATVALILSGGVPQLRGQLLQKLLRHLWTTFSAKPAGVATAAGVGVPHTHRQLAEQRDHGDQGVQW